MASIAPTADCAAGFPWYATARQTTVLAGLGVRNKWTTKLAGPDGAQVKETVIHVDRKNRSTLDKIRAAADQCGTQQTRADFHWITVGDRETATRITGDLLVGVEFQDTDLSPRTKAAVAQRAVRLASELA